MSIDKRNNEGYYDPTAYEALSLIEKEDVLRAFRPIVFICSPYAGDIEKNVKSAQGYCRFAVDRGFIPVAPHLLYPQFMDDGDEDQRTLGLRFAIALLCRCDELWVFGEKVSGGMAKEIEKAEKRGMRIRRFNSKCEEVQMI